MRTQSKATPLDITSAFRTSDPFKAVAIRLGLSPNTLRTRWVAEFGVDAFKARAQQCHLDGNAARRGLPSKERVFQEEDVHCSQCSSVQRVRKVRIARMDRAAFQCDACEATTFNTPCPVCGLKCRGLKGLSKHMSQRVDAGHTTYRLAHERARWGGKLQDQDFVVCLVCGHKAETLARHLGAAHQMSAEDYISRFGRTVRIRSTTLASKRSEIMSHRPQGFGKGDTKQILCPSCGETRLASKFLVPGTHDFRCGPCKAQAEEALWQGKSEPQDYVTCRACGYRAESLNSHLQNAHPELMSFYQKRFPESQVVALNSRGSVVLTVEDFEPFKLKNSKIFLARAMTTLGYSFRTLKREAHRLKLPTFSRVRQHRCLEAVSEVLGGAAYIEEWNSADFVNPKTGRRFRFDGFFPDHNLLVEFHGHQHWKFPNTFMKAHHLLAWDLMLERDQQKEALVRATPGLHYLVVREDEPFWDESHLRSRLGQSPQVVSVVLMCSDK